MVYSADLTAASRLIDQLHASRPDQALQIVREPSVDAVRVRLGSGSADLAVLDLAGMDRRGPEVRETIRSLSASAPVVVLLGAADETEPDRETHTEPPTDPDILELLRVGASDVLTTGDVTAIEAARVVGLAAEHRRRSSESDADLVAQWLLLDLARSGHAGVGLTELPRLAADVLAEALSASSAAVVELVGDTAVLRGGVGLPDDQMDTVVATTRDGSWVATAMASGSGHLVTAREPGDGSMWLVHPVHVGSRRWGLVGAALPAIRDPTERESAYLGQLAACLAAGIATSGSDARLGERVRELTALRAIAEASAGETTPEELVSAVAAALVLGVRYPDAAVVEVVMDGCRVRRPPGQRTAPVWWRGSVAVVVHDEVRGRVEVAYRRPVLRPDELDELLRPTAAILSSWLRRTDADERLRDSEARDRLQAEALATAPSAVFITDASGRIEWVNDAFTELSGYPAERAIGATPRLLSSGRQTPEVYEELWDTLADGRVWRGELVNRNAEGHDYVVSQTITPVRGEGGRSTHFVAIQEDITERVRTQRELDASRQRLQALFDTALDAIALTDDQGRYLDVNPAMERLTGYPRADLLVMHPQDLAVSEVSDLARPDLVDEVVGRGDGPWPGGSEAGIFPLRRGDGTIVETEYRAVADIQPGVHLSVLRDVTAHRAMVRELADREARIRRLAEGASDIVAQLTRDPAGGWQVDYVNRAATELLGYPRHELEADPAVLSRFLDEPQQPGDPLGPLFSGDEHTVTITARVPRADGSGLWFEVNVTRTEQSSEPTTVQLIARDVTARRQTLRALEQALHDQREAGEHLRSLSAMKDTFLQSVSHELRTPLTAIHGFASLLTGHAGEVSGDRARLFNERILANANRLHRLLDDLLDVDRVARGSAQPARTATDLAALVRQTVAEVDLEPHPLALDLEPVTLPVDAAWVERIVDNLIGNVVRHTPGSTRIWIRLRPSERGATLIVDDDGPGIVAEDRQRVLEPFQQGGSAASAASPGTGMGLALVDSFARMHGGDVTIGESPWGGARVTVRLGHD